ncbi:hypothetical protein Lalb_Chr22g0359911 [Lupinus albus]|uniref:Uncharacterized protein n=1 Tax=Lupinus albus TaxID=3870 RepID=A0A6A4NQH0_LUPAL|nr:hypothetical protein Lalb_Chr22g0359911 [Lupinus albus]
MSFSYRSKTILRLVRQIYVEGRRVISLTLCALLYRNDLNNSSHSQLVLR